MWQVPEGCACGVFFCTRPTSVPACAWSPSQTGGQVEGHLLPSSRTKLMHHRTTHKPMWLPPNQLALQAYGMAMEQFEGNLTAIAAGYKACAKESLRISPAGCASVSGLGRGMRCTP